MAKKILIVDDSQTVRQQVSLALGPGGFEVIEAFDGMDGLSACEHTPDTAMIICDVNMPRMDGLDMVEALQKSGLKVPIVMLTTDGQIKKTGHDLKKLKVALFKEGVIFDCLDFDVMIAAYLLNPSRTSYALEDLALENLGEFIRLGFGKGKIIRYMLGYNNFVWNTIMGAGDF